MVLKKHKTKFSAIVFFVLIMVLISQTGTSVLYEDTNGRYSIMFPIGWTMDSAEGTDVVYADPTADDFRENINIITTDARGAKNSASYVQKIGDETLDMFKIQFDATVVTQPSTTKINDHWTVTYTIDFSYEGIDIRESQTLVVSEGYKMVFIITCAATESSFDDYQSRFNYAVSTFKVLNEPSFDTSSDGLLFSIIIGAVVGGFVAGVVAFIYKRNAK